MAMNALGREFNLVHTADGAVISLRDAGGVTFIVHEATTATTATFTRSKDGGAPVAFPAVITTYWTTAADGSAAWARQPQTAAATVQKTTAAAQDVMVIEIDADDLRADGGDFNEVICSADGSATVVAVLRDLKMQRAPENLPAVIPA